MESGFFNSISFKFNSIAVVGVTIILSVFGIYDYLDSKKSLHKELSNNADLLIHRLQINLPIAMWNYQTEQIELNLDSELTSNYVKEIYIFEEEKFEKLLLAKSVDNLGEKQRITDIPSIKYINSGIHGKLTFIDEQDETKNVGTAIVFLDYSHLNQKLQALVIRLITQTLLLDIIVMVMLTLLCRGVVTNPINAVADAMENIAQGEGDLTQRLVDRKSVV